MRKDAVRGLTTAATVWLVAGVGMAGGGGLPVVAVAATVGHFLITRGFPPLSGLIGRLRRTPPTPRLTYLDGHGVLRGARGVHRARLGGAAGARGSGGHRRGR